MSNILITIGRQIGSGGLEIASKVAEKLGIELYDKNLLNLTAKGSGLSADVLEKKDEKPVPANRFAKFLGLRGSNYTDPQFYSAGSVLSEDELFKIQSSVIEQLADEASGVFVGRCADYILRGRDGLLTFFLTADMLDRVARIASKRGITEEEAEKFIQIEERKRKEYYGYYTFKEWGDSSSYDICLNTSRIGVDAAANLIISLYHQIYG